MRYLIYFPNLNKYANYLSKVILFNSEEEAEDFLNAFIEYSLNRASSENPFVIADVVMTRQNAEIRPIEDYTKISYIFSEDL